jgi:large subunit ribosomal protein L10
LVLTLERESLTKKAKDVEELTQLINTYSVLGIADLYKVRAIQLQELAKKFRSLIQLKVTKNILLKMALRNSKKIGIEKLIDTLKGSNILLLTNMDPFKLLLLLEKNKIKMVAKTGDIAPNDIIVPAGNTALPPGPAISELHDVGVRTKIDSGSVWALRDTVITKKGETVTSKVASILPKLGIKSLEVGLKLVAAYDDGLVITSSQLFIDLNAVRRQFEDAFNKAFNLSISVVYPTKETLNVILWKAASNARNLAISSVYFVPEVASQLIAKAYADMATIAIKLSKMNKEAVPIEFRGQ